MPPTTPPITAEELVQAATLDPTSSWGNGTLTALSMYRSEVPEVLTERAATPTRPRPKMNRSTPGLVSPPSVAGTDAARDLTPGEAAWVASLPTDPAKVSAQDANALADLSSVLKSPAEQRLVASRLDGLRTRYAAQHELRNAEVDLATMPTVVDPRRSPGWFDWCDAIGARIRQDVPELSKAEADGRAADLVAATVQKSGSTARRDLRTRIGNLCREHNLKTTYFVGTERWGLMGDDNRSEFRAELLKDASTT